MTEERTAMRKSISLEPLRPLLADAERVEYWGSLQPHLTITEKPFLELPLPPAPAEEIDAFAGQLKDDGYFQTEPLLSAKMLDDLLGAVEAVRAAGFPPTFALVYDVFYEAIARFDGVLAGLLGRGYQLIPNFWVYYIAPSDEGKGFEPHRDAEFAGTIGPDGMPTVLTIWITITEATPLNSCMYVVPKPRDPLYAEAVRDLTTPMKGLHLEDIRVADARRHALVLGPVPLPLGEPKQPTRPASPDQLRRLLPAWRHSARQRPVRPPPLAVRFPGAAIADLPGLVPLLVHVGAAVGGGCGSARLLR